MVKSTYSIDELKSTWGDHYKTAPSFYFNQYAFRITFNTVGCHSYGMLDRIVDYFDDLQIPIKPFISYHKARIYIDDIEAVCKFTNRYDIIIQSIDGPATDTAFGNRHDDNQLVVKKEYRDDLWHGKYEYKMTIVLDQYYVDNWDMLKDAISALPGACRITHSGNLINDIQFNCIQSNIRWGSIGTCTIHIKTEDDLTMLKLTSNIKPKVTYQCIIIK